MASTPGDHADRDVGSALGIFATGRARGVLKYLGLPYIPAPASWR